MLRFLLAFALIFCVVNVRVQSQDQKTTAPGHYLFAWTGDVAHKGNDFLAVIDADPVSPSYGHLVTTVATDQQTMYVHHTEYTMPASGMLFANDHDAGRTFIFDVRDPHHPKDLLTTPYVFDPSQAATMTKAGADILVAHMGLTTGGTIGAETALALETCAGRIDAIAAAALDVRSDIIVLCHGGPIAEPADAALVLSNTRHCHGFYGASSMERLPTEKAITKQTHDFKRISFPRRRENAEHGIH